MKCNCGREINEIPSLFIGRTELGIPVIQMSCVCGKVFNAPLNTMKPFVAEKQLSYPPGRGEYFKGKDGSIIFCCPICKTLFGINSPVHTISDTGVITPSVVCPQGCGFHAWTTLHINSNGVHTELRKG